MSDLLGDTRLQFTLTVAKLPPTTFSVADFELHEAFSSLFTLNLQLASVDPAIDFGKVLDEDATLTVWRNEVPERTVTGMVASFEQGDIGFRRTHYRMVVRPHFWRTTLRQNSRIFQQQNLVDILSTLMQENGRIDWAYAFKYSHPVREFCVQYAESDYDFIQRLTAEEGIFYYVEFANNRHQIIFTDEASAQSKGVTLPYNANKNAQRQESCIYPFRISERVRTAKVQLKDYTFQHPLWPAKFDYQSRNLDNQRETYAHFDFPGRFKDEQPGKDFTRYRLEALRNDANLGSGASNCCALLPGEFFTLHSHPRPDLNKCWQIVSICHIGIQPQALEEDAGEQEQGTTLTNNFFFIPDRQTWRPTPLAKPRIDGPQIAKVVGPKGEEIYTDKYGRVRLQFLWDRYATGDDTSSCWIRVSQAWAGQRWGMMALPRIGQEVIVDFLNGDPDQPIVTGRTYHANNLPPNELPAAKTQMIIRSKTHKGQGFNELKFDDEAGNEEVYIHAQRNMNTQIGHQQATFVGENRINHIKQDDHLRVEGEKRDEFLQDYSLSVKQSGHLKAERKWLIAANEEIHLNSTKRVVLSAGEEIVLKVGSSFIRITEAGVFANPQISVAASCPNLGSLIAPRLPLQLNKTEPIANAPLLQLFDFSG